MDQLTSSGGPLTTNRRLVARAEVWRWLGGVARAWLLVGLVLVSGGAAWAAPDDDRARAEKLIQEGLTLARSKQFREAIPKFEAALKLYPHPEIQHNLARAHEELGELRKAFDYFTQALLKGEYTFAADGRQRLRRIEGELRKSYARVTVRTTPSQVNVLLIFPSGEEETHVTTPFQAWIPAGRTQLVGTNPAFKTAEQTLDLAAGEDREVSVVLLPLPKQGFLQVSVNQPGATISLSGKTVGRSPLPGTAFDVGVYELLVELEGYVSQREQIVINEDSVTTVNVALVSEDELDTGGGVPAWVGWTLVGSGAVAGGIAAYLQFGKAYDAEQRAKELPEDNVVDFNRLIEQSRDYQTAAIATTVVAGVLIGTGVYLLVFEPETEQAASRPTFAPSVALTPEGGLLGGTFTF